jgi:hypothetical protein
MQLERKRYEIMLEAHQPIAHHEETIGNEAIIMRRKIRQRDGWASVPVVTADTMRHGLREAAAYALLDAAGMLESPQLSEAALRLLFAGGMVTGRGEASVCKLEQYREMCELIPSMALFGGCADNRIIPGRLTVEDATLLCEETERYVPHWMLLQHAGQLDTCRSHVEEQQRVRMDPTLIPHNRLLLAESSQVEINRRLTSSEGAHEDSDAVEKERTKSTMMPRRFERVAQGSLFSWAVEALCYSELDVDTFNVSVAAFLSNARVGGKRGTGHGGLRPVAANEVKLQRPADSLEPLEVRTLGLAVGKLFKQHVEGVVA